MYIIVYMIFAFISQWLTYKFIKRIDKKERKFLKQWEKEYIDNYKELWKQSYFEKLAEEKKIKEYEATQKKDKEETKSKLKEVTIDDQYKEIYEENLNNAIEKLEKLELEE